MHITAANLLATATAAASLTAAAAAPPQITSPPSAQALMARGGGIFEQPRQRVQIDPPGLRPGPLNDVEKECMYHTYASLTSFDIPPMTDRALNSWMAASGQHNIQTVTDISEVDEMCITTDDLRLPASLTSAYSAWFGEFESWKKGFHDEAYSIAERCGERYGPVFWMLVATDGEECRTAVSALFGVTAGVMTMTTTTTTMTMASVGTSGERSAKPRGLVGSSLSTPGSPVETASSSTLTRIPGAEESNAAAETGGNSGPRDSGAIVRLAEMGLAVVLAACAGVACLL